MSDPRFTRRLYTVPEAARLVGMSPSTLDTWAHGYGRRPEGRSVVKQGPVVTSLGRTPDDGRSIPFIGLVEASVVQAFRQTGLPMQRIRRALEVLTEQGELDHALAPQRLYSDGAEVLYDCGREPRPALRQWRRTVVGCASPRRRRRTTRPEPSPGFFLDRGLGRHLVADAIRRRGYTVLPMAKGLELGVTNR
jgi:hypothetical protein